MAQKIEIELHYHLNNKPAFIEKLDALGARHVEQHHIIDHWFLPNDIKTDEAQRKWFDIDCGMGLRIREIEQADGSMKTSLGAKRVVNEDGHNALAEAEFEIEGYQAAIPLVGLMDRREFLTIDKKREVYMYKNFEIVIDDIKGYGTGVEIEIVSEESREHALQDIRNIAEQLGLSEGDEHDISITVSAMKNLAQY